MRNPLHHCMLTLALLGLIACGSEQPEAAETATPTEAAATIDAEAVMDRLVLFMDEQTAMLEEIAEGVEGVVGHDSANRMVQQLREEFLPRNLGLFDDFLDWAATDLLSLNEEQRAELEASFEDEESHSHVDRLHAAESRMDNAAMRIDRELEMLYARNPLLIPAVEEGILALGRAAEQFMHDERMLALEQVMASGSVVEAGQTDEIGSPAWCQRMANTPQGQWTMNDGFAFASHCTGG